MQSITPFLWFDTQALDAANFYVSVFKKGSKVLSTMPGPNGKVMHVTFKLMNQNFYALNGGPHFKFTEAISFFITVKTQKEVDYYWTALSKGGAESQCGWVKDKFGLSWQIVPEELGKCLGGNDSAGSARAMQAMLKMKKLDIQKLKDAYKGK